MKITQDLVKNIFNYIDGRFYWKIKPNRRIIIGSEAGCIAKFEKGHRYFISILGKQYLRSRIVFLYHKGYLPIEIDHKDRNKLNDRIENLRDVNHSENMINRPIVKNIPSRNITSKYLGVSLNRRKDKWESRLNINGVCHRKDNFNNEEDAALEYNKMAVKYHGEFANLNIIQTPSMPD